MAKQKVYELDSYNSSVGHELLSWGYTVYWLTVGLCTLAGVIVAFVMCGGINGGGLLAAIFFGLLAYALSSLVAGNVMMFIHAKGEMLLRVARIQEDIDYLCKVKEMELNAAAAGDAVPLDLHSPDEHAEL